MKKFMVGSIAFAAVAAGPAMAADLAVKRPVYRAPPPVAVFTWTGCYIGAHGGFGWGRDKNDFGHAVLLPAPPGSASGRNISIAPASSARANVAWKSETSQ